MAGSRTWRPYNSSVPAGGLFVVEVDESNARATANGSELMPSGALLGVQKPKTLTMRAIRARLINNPFATRKFWVADPAVWAAIAADPQAQVLAPYSADPSDGTGGVVLTWIVTSASQEKYSRRPRRIDSSLIDGTPAD
jgi:hypothetical protein